jgi:glucokinase
MSSRNEQREYLVGVDLGGGRILAGVFTESLQFKGKAKLSPKPERGPRVVMDRITRCIRDAVDECDLALGQIKCVGLGVPGGVDGESGRVLDVPPLGRERVSLKAELEQRLQRPVAIENDCNVAALGIYTQELASRPATLAAVFLERPGAVGVIVGGEFQAGLPRDFALALGPIAAPAGGQSMRNPAKQLRKALQAGEESAQQRVAELAERTGAFVAQIINRLKPDVVALGGPTMEELKDWILPAVHRNVHQLVRSDLADEVDILVSEMGKNAGIVGGAVLALALAREAWPASRQKD